MNNPIWTPLVSTLIHGCEAVTSWSSPHSLQQDCFSTVLHHCQRPHQFLVLLETGPMMYRMQQFIGEIIANHCRSMPSLRMGREAELQRTTNVVRSRSRMWQYNQVIRTAEPARFLPDAQHANVVLNCSLLNSFRPRHHRKVYLYHQKQKVSLLRNIC